MTSAKERLIEIFKSVPDISNAHAGELAGCSREHARKIRKWVIDGMPPLNYGAGVKHEYPKKRKETPGNRSRFYKAKPEGIKIKCLGHIKPEHTFMSEDTKYNRVCSRCRASWSRDLHGGIE